MPSLIRRHPSELAQQCSNTSIFQSGSDVVIEQNTSSASDIVPRKAQRAKVKPPRHQLPESTESETAAKKGRHHE